MILPPALSMSAFCGAALLTWWAVGDAGWSAMAHAARQTFAGQLPSAAIWPIVLAPLAAGVLGAWAVAWSDRALVRRVEALHGDGPTEPVAWASDAWVLVGAMALLGACLWAGDWEVAGRARPGAVLDGWVRWSWRLAALTCVGLAATGIAQASQRYANAMR